MESLPPYPSSFALAEPGNWGQLDMPEAYGRLETASSTLVLNGLFDELPASPDAAQESNYQFRARVIGERLWLLGYIDGSKQLARVLYLHARQQFLDAVEAFQRDSLIKADRWVGQKTWNTLEELVSFEGLDLSNRWFNQSEWPPALLRAVQLRLYILGVGTRRPTPAFTHVSKPAVRKIHFLLDHLGLREISLGNELDWKTIKPVLQLDTLTEALNRIAEKEPGGFRWRKLPARLHQARLISKFTVQLAKIELWLLGAEITLSSVAEYPLHQLPGNVPVEDPRQDPIGLVLFTFYHQVVGMVEMDAIQHSNAIRPDLFNLLSEHENAGIESETSKEEVELERIALEFSTQEEVELALNKRHSLGLRLWDGVKRIGRWLKRKVKQVVEFARNKLRIFYHFASKGFAILQRTIRACVSSVKTYIAGEITAADGKQFAKISGDFDIQVFNHQGISGETSSEIGSRLRLFSRRFMLTVLILKTVLSAIIHGTLKAWARLAHALVSSLKRVLPLYYEIEQLEERLAE